MSLGVILGATLGTIVGSTILLGVVIFLLLWLLPYDSALVPPVEYDPTPTPALDDSLWETPEYRRTTLFFRAATGERLGAWLYEPKKNTGVPPPVVIMAHGIGLQKDMGLHSYAHTFATRGLACLVFDYRTFGNSEGLPRNWASPKRYIQDWLSAIDFAQTGIEGRVDPARIALWGTSYSGGHVIVAAARRSKAVRAVSSQVPHLNGWDAGMEVLKRRGVATMARMGWAWAQDAVKTSLGGTPGYIISASTRPEDFALMEAEKFVIDGWHGLKPKAVVGGWKNRMRVNIIMETEFYFPDRWAKSVQCPMLLAAGREDVLCPYRSAVRMAKSNPLIELLPLECGHYEPYGPNDIHDKLKAKQADFLLKNLQHDCATAVA
eukprot:jgi/Botrbrau1/1005/Bobra.114_1s0043.1